MNELIKIQKADGQEDIFNPDKVLRSMERANVADNLQREALKHIESAIYPGITTREIYARLFDYLKTQNRPSAARYSLKNAIMALGPSGFPFEKIIARIFEAQGYKTQNDIILEGECVSHEVDVVAEKEGEKIMVEAKFHNQTGTRSDVRVALYVWARFQDLAPKHGFTQACLATNTKLTGDALNYAQCKKMRVISWEYPPGESLPRLIEKTNLHPITECVNFNNHEKEILLDRGYVVLTDILEEDVERLSQETGIPRGKIHEAKEDIRAILSEEQ